MVDIYNGILLAWKFRILSSQWTGFAPKRRSVRLSKKPKTEHENGVSQAYIAMLGQ